MRASLTVSGMLRRATVLEASSSRVGISVAVGWECGEAAEAGETAEPFVAVSGAGDADVRDAMRVAVCRFVGFAVAMETVRMRDLNLVLLSSRAELASSCKKVSKYLRKQSADLPW